jgi:hypothetical protein
MNIIYEYLWSFTYMTCFENKNDQSFIKFLWEDSRPMPFLLKALYWLNVFHYSPYLSLLAIGKTVHNLASVAGKETQNMNLCTGSWEILERSASAFHMLDKVHDILYQCSDGVYITQASMCDNEIDCIDGDDEDNCGTICTAVSCQKCLYPTCSCNP